MTNPKKLIHLCLNTPRVPAPIRELAKTMHIASQPGRPRTYTITQAREVIRLHGQRVKLAEITEKTGVPRSTIYAILSRR